MALSKLIKFDKVETNYHRIIEMRNVINKNTFIEVGSYTSEQRRDNEIEINELRSKNYDDLTPEEKDRVTNMENIYVHYSNYMLDYKEDLTIEEAYDYLKTLDEFKDAENV